MNGTPAEEPYEVVTTAFPVAAAEGTGTTMLVELQLVGWAFVPLKVTVLVPWLAPKLTPEIVTDVPTGPAVGDKLLIVGICDTVNGIPLLVAPPTVTTMFPEVAVIGTGTTMLVEFQPVGDPATPLNVTVLVP